MVKKQKNKKSPEKTFAPFLFYCCADHAHLTPAYSDLYYLVRDLVHDLSVDVLEVSVKSLSDL